MNSKELRIGNVVEYLDGGGYTELSGIAIHSFDCGILQIKPIELTEEWLIKFEFEKSNHIDSFYQLRIINDWTFIYYNPEYEVCELSISRHGSVIKEFKYVHQLQNLYFALTGEELELKQ